MEAAKHRFERGEDVPNWSLHADTIEVKCEKNDKTV